MSDIKYSIEDILSLVEQNFFFLHMGKFLANYIKKHNLSSEAQNLNIVLGEKQSYLLHGDIIKDLLNDSFIKWNQGNILGYFVEWNAFRGITMAIREGINGNQKFKNFLKTKLKDKFNHFDYIIAFIRNTLSHNIDNEIILRNKKDFEGTKNSFKKNVNSSGFAQIEIVYSKDLPDISCENKNYGFKIEVDFCSLKEGQKFTDIITEWQLFMMAELCYNLVRFYRNEVASN